MAYEKGFGYMGLSAGKLFQYLAEGRSIVCNINIAYDNVIGIACDIETSEALSQSIRNICEQPSYMYQAMCEHVRETAGRFDYNKLVEGETKVIETAYAS